MKNVQDIYPLSPLQSGMLFHSLMEPESGVYVNQLTCALPVDLDPRLFRQAWETLVKRHGALRTAFLWEGLDEPLQVVRKSFSLPWQELDWSGLPADEQQRRCEELRRRDRHTPLALGKTPLMRFSLVRLDRERAFIWTFHHLLLDGWSVPLLVQELGSVYTALQAGREPALPPVRPFSDFIVWLQKQDLSRAEPFWRRELAGFAGPTPLNIECRIDHPAGAAATSDYAEHQTAVSREVTAGLQTLAARHNLTLQTITLGAWAVLLSRYCREEDVVFGGVVSGRPAALPGVETMIGLFINTLPVRALVSGAEPLVPWLQRLQKDQLTRHELEHTPLVQIQRWSEVPAGSPLFETLYVFENYPAVQGGEPGGLLVGNLRSFEATNYPVTLLLMRGDRIPLRLVYDRTRVEEAAVPRLLHHFNALLSGMTEGTERRLGQLELLTPEERLELLAQSQGPRRVSSSPGLPHLLVSEQARRAPGDVAVFFGDQQLTYAELDHRSNQLARRLRALGVTTDSRVGLCAERSLDMSVAVIGILKAGAAYVPLDPAYPRERLAFMIEDAHVPVLLTQRRLLGCLPEIAAVTLCLDADWSDIARESGEPFPSRATAESLAYVIFTSGSTGRPKGVALPHGALRNLIDWHLATLLGGVPTLQFASLSFDASFHEMFACWGSGGTLVVVPEELRRDMPALAPLLMEKRIEKVVLPVVVFTQLAEVFAASEDLPPLREITTTGERLQTNRAMAALLRRLPGCAFHNHYGPSETHVATAFTLSPDPEGWEVHPSIGRPIWNSSTYVLEPGLTPSPFGVPGELYIGGACLARGYLGRPELTAQRFVPDPFGGEPGARLYRTGDKVRLSAGGNLEFLGRFDDQVKIRGFRIEPGEIEEALIALTGVREAVVLARQDTPGAPRLVAYVVGDVAPGALRRWLRERLPDYMVPAAFVTLAALPLTPNRKVDRKALPAPEWQSTAKSSLAPRTPVEEILAGIWAELLGLPAVGIQDDFFALGGHSLLAAQVTSRIRRSFAAEIPLRRLFELRTIAALAPEIEAAAGTTGTLPDLEPQTRVGDPPLSFAQLRLWFLAQLEPASAAYNVPSFFGVSGPIDRSRLEAALSEVVRRHEILRTSFVEREGVPVQRIAPPQPWSVPLIDLSVLPAAKREAEARLLAHQEAWRPFDLSRLPLLRTVLFRLAGEEHALLLAAHHIVSDGWSLGVLTREVAALLAALERGLGSPLPPLPVQYADYAIWQQSWLQGDLLEQQLAFWRRQLLGTLPVLDLPTDRPRPALQAFRGAQIPFALPAGLLEWLRGLAQQEGATLFMVLLASLEALLCRITEQEDFCIGSPVAGRIRLETEPLIGLFVNTMVHRADLSGTPRFDALLARVRETALAAHAHQEIPFEKLVERLQPERNLSHSPLFQVMFAFQISIRRTEDLPGLSLRPLEIDSVTAKFDLNLMLDETGDGVLGSLEFDTGIFDRTTAARLLTKLRTLLDGIVEAPQCPVRELPLSPEPERHQVLVEWNDTEADRGEPTLIHELFEAWAGRTPEAIAAVCGGESMTYGAVEAQANRLARHLASLGVGPGSLVGIHLQRSLGMIPALLAVLKAGAAYVPLEIGHPEARLRWILGALDISCLVTETAQLGTVRTLAASLPALTAVVCLDRVDPARHEPSPPPRRGTADDLAYIIFTSGSTGTPKGVMVRHRPVINLLRWAHRTFAFSPADRVLFVTSLSFDLSVFDIFGLLGAGGSIRIATEGEIRDPEFLLRALAQEPITFWDSAPATLEQTVPFLDEKAGMDPRSQAALRLVFLSGDWIPVALPDRIRGRFPGARVVSLGGATEATVWSNVFPIAGVDPAWTSIPYGHAIENARYHVLDAQLAPCPMGAPGDLYIGGDCLADGYAREPELTAQKFLPDPWGAMLGIRGARLYRTGDRARYRPDGNLEFLGRLDTQVKIRGFRIELGEIEAALSALAGVREAVVAVRQDRSEMGPGDRRLVAYVVGDLAGEAADALRRPLRERLPDYMMPAAFVRLAALPLTPNGKVDRKALPAPEWQGAEVGSLAPRTPVEEVLAGIWAELLGLERAGTADHFFDLGGHSLLATQVMSRLRSAFGVEMPLRDLFEAPTPAELAARVEAARRTGTVPPAPHLGPVSRKRPLPLSFAQQRLWFIDQLEPGSPLYNMPVALRAKGPLDAGALALTLGEIVRRHEALRTTFATQEGVPVQVIQPAAPSGLTVVDLSGLRERTRETAAVILAGEEAGRPFDLGRGPLLRGVLLRLAEDDHIAALTLHHIVSDAWSTGILVREVVALYAAFAEGRPSPLPELPVQYADFAVWQRGWLDREVLEGLVAHWRQRLAGAPPQLDLPGARPRPAALSLRGAACRRRFSPPLLEQLRALGRRESATLFMTLLAPLQALLHSRTGATDLVVGTDVAGRDHRETEGLIGFFINQLPLRANLAGNPSLRELLGRVRETALEAYAHQDLPFDQLVEALRGGQSLRRSPVFQVKLVLQNAPRENLNLPGLTLEAVPSSTETAQLDLHWNVLETGEELWLTVTYSTDLYDEPLIDGLLDEYELWLHAFAERPETQLGDVIAELAQVERARRAQRGLELKSKGFGKLQSLRRQAKQLMEV